MTLTRCTCPVGFGSLIAPLADYEIESGYTRFVLLRCMTCGRVHGMPDENLTIALELGTPHTLQRLRDLTKLH